MILYIKEFGKKERHINIYNMNFDGIVLSYKTISKRVFVPIENICYFRVLNEIQTRGDKNVDEQGRI